MVRREEDIYATEAVTLVSLFIKVTWESLKRKCTSGIYNFDVVLPRSMYAHAPYLILISICLYLWFSRTKHVYPPGPKGYPVIGNFFDFPSVEDLVTRVQTWRKVSSPPDPWFLYLMPDVGVWCGSKELLLLFCDGRFQGVLSIYQHLAWICWFWMTSKMLLTCLKSADPSTRVTLTSPWWETCMSPTDLSPCHLTQGCRCGFDRFPSIASDGLSPRLRALRKVLEKEIGAKHVDDYKPLMQREVVKFLKKLLDQPQDFVTHSWWWAYWSFSKDSSLIACEQDYFQPHHVDQL